MLVKDLCKKMDEIGRKHSFIHDLHNRTDVENWDDELKPVIDDLFNIAKEFKKIPNSSRIFSDYLKAERTFLEMRKILYDKNPMAVSDIWIY